MRHLEGMRAFYVVWAGQTISTLGSYLVSFALGIWIYEKTGSVSLLALNMLAFVVPELLLSPLAGVVADRFNRRAVMLISDGGAALSSIFLLVMMLVGDLQLWQIYVATIWNAACQAFQWPSAAALTPQLVPQERLGRANGLIQMGEAAAYLFGPALAGVFYVSSRVGVGGIVLIDVLTFGCALLTLSLVRIPVPTPTPESEAHRGKFLEELRYGWGYIVTRPGLFGLMIFFALLQFFQEFTYPLIQPLLLDIAEPDAMGGSFSLMALGMVIGMGLMSLWDGSKYRVQGMLALGVLEGLAMILAGSRPALVVITVGGFIYFVAWPVVEASNQALWQRNVAPDVQGRAFALRNAVAAAMRPIALIAAGPLADQVFRPLLLPGGALANTPIARLVGVGAGRGVGLLIMVLGLCTAAVSLAALAYRPIRRLEEKTAGPVGERAGAQAD
jgi:MFS family permease